ncbi:MAG: DUF4359 domain-containing protein [Leptolyngbya sp. RL_3_1]|nr:DUF4359 domain-containing protein [Leptolyngbya sp. RL_3_1]
MKPVSLVGLVVTAAAVGGLVATNPDPVAYEDYALKQASAYFNDELCDQLPQPIADLFQQQCIELIQTGQPQLQALIRDRTHRLNLGVFSIYKTALEVPEISGLPAYRVETLAIAGQFITYKAEGQPQP